MADLKPKAMIGFGGYPTIPPMLAALARGIPSMIQEQNSVMGRANRFLAPMVKAIALSFEDTKFLEGKLAEKAYVTGTPLREQVLELRGGVYQPAQPGQPLNLLVFGGSQGARFFSDIMPVALQLLPQDIRDRLMVVEQCREEDIDRVFDAYEVAGVAAELATFFDDLPYRMAGAHLVVCRAGATTVAELSALGRPAVLVPLPNSVDNDQLENATRFEKAGAGWCFEQSIMTAERLAGTLRRLFEEPATLARAASRSKSLARFDAVARLADLVVTLAEAPETFSAQRETEGHVG
jgi:UDP-N-acetylglucosamine--N-acetylmuramyl-(pentapeptide) pyrophosphoryl-undecaprenol N-acetylglucosamine transferase